MPTFGKPEALDSIEDEMDKDIYIEDVNAFVKYNRVLTRSSKNLYSLVLGRCTEILRAKMKGKKKWKTTDKK